MKNKKMAMFGLEIIRCLAAELGSLEKAVERVKTYISTLEAATAVKTPDNRGDRETLKQLELGLAALAEIQ